MNKNALFAWEIYAKDTERLEGVAFSLECTRHQREYLICKTNYISYCKKFCHNKIKVPTKPSGTQ